MVLIEAMILSSVAPSAAYAQDSGEGAAECEAPQEQQQQDDPEEEGPPEESTDESVEAPADPLAEVTPDAAPADAQAVSDVVAEPPADGGDVGDGGAAPGDAAGSDGPGADTGAGGGGDDGGASAGGDWGGAAGGFGETGGGGGVNDGRLSYAADPIDLRMADKVHVQIDYRSSGAAPLRWARSYHSNTAAFAARVTVPMGTGWHSYYDRSLQVLSPTEIRLHRANGDVLPFSLSGGSWNGRAYAGVLQPISGGWQYVNTRDGIETYNSAGRLQTLTIRGLVTSLQYDAAGRLAAVVNPFGRRLGITYDAGGRVATVILPGGKALAYQYGNAGNLVAVRFADNSLRQYVYENAAFPNALTGVIDESGKRRLTWGYDSAGRPNSAHYGSSTTGLKALGVTYSGDMVQTLDSRGTQRSRTYRSVGGRRVLESLELPGTKDMPKGGIFLNHDARGFLQQVALRTGEVRQYTVDNRGRRTSVVRNAQTSSSSRATVATWHPLYRKPTSISYAGVTRSFDMDALGRVTQVRATAAGTTVTLLARSYSSAGLLTSSTDARGITRSYSYDALGNRTGAVLSKNQTVLSSVTYGNHDAHGLAQRIETSDGTVVTRTFDARGFLATRTVNGKTTTYSRDAAGRMLRATRADGSWSQVGYDDKAFKASITNQRGELKLIGRDATGREVSRSTFDAAGNLRSGGRVEFNSQGRLAAAVDSRGARTAISYGPDVRPAFVTDPSGQTIGLTWDALDRLTRVTLPNTSAMRSLGGPATVTNDFSYDVASASLATVRDARSVTTSYAYDVSARLAAESSADAGSTKWQRAAASGDVSSVTDARGVVTTITRDALGRIVQLSPSTGDTPIAMGYVASAADNRPAWMTDGSGSTQWTYDSAGRLLSKTQVTEGITRRLTLVRDALGRVVQATYPSGLVVGYGYSADQLVSVTLNGKSFINAITYRPMTREITGWRWSDGSVYTRNADADGRITQVSIAPGVLRSYTHDSAGRVTQYVDSNAAGVTTIAYDEAGHIAGVSGPGEVASYAWDANHNRLSSTRNGTSSTHAHQAGTNRLLSVAGANARSYTYDATGNPDAETVNGTTRKLDFDGFNRLVALRPSNGKNVYRLYNGQGLRVGSRLQTYPTGAPKHSSHFMHDDAGHLLGEYGVVASNTQQETVWLGGLPVGAVIDRAVYRVYADAIGAPRSLAQEQTGANAWTWISEPFGTAQPVSALGVVYNLRYPGQQYDPDSGYFYNWMRDYVPETERYVQADPIGLAGGMSRYAYVGGNPVSKVDVLGLDPFRAPGDTAGTVGRPGTLVPPGGIVGEYIETQVLYGYKFGEYHDYLVDILRGAGIPDLLANVPTMPLAYFATILAELPRDLQKYLNREKLQSCPSR